MSKYVIEVNTSYDNSDTFIIIKTAKENNIEYKTCNIKQLEENISIYKDYIPIGTIRFVQKWLNLVHRIEKENPIEIPKYLRDKEFTKRDYKVVKASEIPLSGKYFIKQASKLKAFTYKGYMDFSNIQGMLEEKQSEFDLSTHLEKDEPMVVSEYINNIYAEYRVYVVQNNISDIILYEGNLQYKPDMDLINKTIELIKENEKDLFSYTLDVYVGRQGTALLEIHNFTSVGLYKENWGKELFTAYNDGISYILNNNKPIDLS